jgi:hypothetical protein
MRYRALLTTDEARRAASLIGEPLHRVLTDGWAARLELASASLSIVPEEVPTPDDEHPLGDVDRVKVVPSSPDEKWDGATCLVANAGLVSSVSVGLATVTFSQSKKVPPSTVRGVTVPAGVGYDWVFVHPDEAPRISGTGAVVELDVALAFITNRHRILFSTNAHFVEAVVDGELRERLNGRVKWLPIAARL